MKKTSREYAEKLETLISKSFDRDYPDDSDVVNVGSIYEVYKKAFESAIEETNVKGLQEALEKIESMDMSGNTYFVAIEMKNIAITALKKSKS
jgi:hypothetical protein